MHFLLRLGTMIELNTEVLVIGSGFGGAVAASRLVEQGRQVVMLERGPWRNTFPTSTMNIRQTAELPRAGWRHLFRNTLASVSDFRLTSARGIGINRRSGTFEINNHADFLSICTSQVGGGSLVWCGAVARPDKPDYWNELAEGVSEAVLAQHYDRVYRELGCSVLGEAAEVPDNWARNWAGMEHLDFSANERSSAAHRLPGRKENREAGWGIGRAESGFREHMSLGCIDGSKASTDAIYVGPALAGGMTLLALCEAERLASAPNGGYAVHARRTDTGARLVIHCQKLVIGAGTYNTLRLLFDAEGSGHLKEMPALGRGIGGNGDEPAFLWDTRVAGQCEPRRGLFSMFHLQPGRRDLTHGFIEADLPSTRWPVFAALVRRLNNTLFLVSMGADTSDGTASFAENRLKIDFDPAKNEINQIGRREHREVARLLGAKLLLIPKRLTLHLAGGARIGRTSSEGVVNGVGEVWNNPDLYIVDSAAFPAAPGGPPALNIAAWASHVAGRMYSSTTDERLAEPVLSRDIRIEYCAIKELSLIFACLAKPLGKSEAESRHLLGAWHAQPLGEVRQRRFRWVKPSHAFTFDVRRIISSLNTLKPDVTLRECLSLAEAWDGSGLAWQWTGFVGDDLFEIQCREIASERGYLGYVYRNNKNEGWFLLNRK
jgi:cholesterol oxidase